MTEPIEEAYFRWLLGRVSEINSLYEYRGLVPLARHLHGIEFEWDITDDENRAEDGRYLRELYCYEEDVAAYPEWLWLECSIFELLVALVDRLSYLGGGPPEGWFFELLDNLYLTEHLHSSRLRVNDVNRRIDVLVNRQYSPNGQGGLFPLRDPDMDQRDVSMWMQANAYLIEKEV